MTAITESKDLNSLEFSALVGSLINYEIKLQTRDGRAKHGKALKASTHYQKEESQRETSLDEEEDEEVKFYPKRIGIYEKVVEEQKESTKRNGEIEGEKKENEKKRL